MRLRLVDSIIIAYCLIMIAVVAIFGGHLDDQVRIIAIYAGCVAITLAFAWLGRFRRFPLIGLVLNLYPLSLLIAFYEVSGMQIHLIFGRFFDEVLVKFEAFFLPVHATILMQQIAVPWVTEIMMFGYFSYLLLLPITVGVLYAIGKSKESEQMLLGLLFAFFACYVGFFLFPIEGPRYYFKGAYSVPLRGYLFRWLTVLIEKKAMLHGGCFPSAHCAAATVMLLLSHRFEKRMFRWVAPIVIILYVSTVYGRYHYPSDAVAGIIVGILAVWLALKIDHQWPGLMRITSNDRREVLLASGEKR